MLLRNVRLRTVLPKQRDQDDLLGRLRTHKIIHQTTIFQLQGTTRYPTSQRHAAVTYHDSDVGHVVHGFETYLKNSKSQIRQSIGSNKSEMIPLLALDFGIFTSIKPPIYNQASQVIAGKAV